MTCKESALDKATTSSLPTIQTDLQGEAIKEKLASMSKKGKLPGFDGSSTNGLASVAAHGTPFDSMLIIDHRDGALSFELKLLQQMPTVFIILLIITIWPGLPLTDGFLSSFQWYERFEANTGVKTWYWYMPLTIFPAPFAIIGSLKKSKHSAQQSALETIEKIQSQLSPK